MSENIRAAVGSARKKNKEREGAVSAAFLSVISGRSMALIGPEGTGRETMISDVCGTVDGKKMDKHMISVSTSKDEILSKVTKDTVAIILNDVFKANSGTMNLIADIIDDPQRATVFGSSADVPSEADEAHSLYDRFLLRAFIGPLHSDETFLSSINDKRDGTATSKISSGDIEKIRNAAVDVTAEDEVLSAILSLRELFKNTGRYVSDGRWKDSVSTIRIAAAAVGERTAGISFMPLLQHILWDDPEDIDDVRASVLMMCTPGGLELNGLYAGSEHLLKAAVESKGAVDESAGFPKIIHCYDCNTSFPSLRRLKEHSISRPRHTYADPHIVTDRGSQDYIKYSYEELVTLLSSKYKWDLFKKSEASEKEMFLNEAKMLRARKKILEDGHDKDRAKLTKDMEKNFWLTEQDKRDLHKMFDLRSARLTEIEGLIADVEFILE